MRLLRLTFYSYYYACKLQLRACRVNTAPHALGVQLVYSFHQLLIYGFIGTFSPIPAPNITACLPWLFIYNIPFSIFIFMNF